MVELLSAVGKPTGLTVGRFRTMPADATSLPLIGVYPVSETAVRVGSNRGPKTEHKLTMRLECRAASTDPAVSADTALDALYVWAIAQLFDDATLGLDAVNQPHALYLVERSAQWDATLADRDYAKLELEIEIAYATLASDVTRLA